MAAAANGTLTSLRLLESAVQTPQSTEDAAGAIAQYNRIAVALAAFATVLDLDRDVETKAVQVREYAKLIRAAVGYVLAMDGVALRLSEDQRDSLHETDENLDDLIDTLEWATDKKATILDLLGDADRSR